MFTLNSELRNYVRTNPIAASFVVMFAVEGRDPNEIAIVEYERIINERRKMVLTSPLPRREHFPIGDLGEAIYRDLRAQYFINQRVFDIEHEPLVGNTFGLMLANWRDNMMKDNLINEYSKMFSATSRDLEERSVAIASYRVI